MGTIMATASLFPQCFMQFEYEYLLLLRSQLSLCFPSHRARVSTPCIFYRKMRSPDQSTHKHTERTEKREKNTNEKKDERKKIARKCELNDAREIYRAIA